MARLQQLHVDIFEEDDRFAIVKHVFVGKTRREAMRYHRAHLKTDSFLRGCEKKGRFRGIRCRIRKHWR